MHSQRVIEHIAADLEVDGDVWGEEVQMKLRVGKRVRHGGAVWIVKSVSIK